MKQKELEKLTRKIEEQFQKEEKCKRAKQALSKTIKKLKNEIKSEALSDSQYRRAMDECESTEAWLQNNPVKYLIVILHACSSACLFVSRRMKK